MRRKNSRAGVFRTIIFLVSFTAAVTAAATVLLATGLVPAFPPQVVPVSREVSTSFASVVEVPSFTYCCMEHEGGFEDLQLYIQALMLETQSQNIYPTGPIMVIYYNDPNVVDPDALVWDVGFPVTPQVMPQAPLYKKVWFQGTVARAVHFGAYYEIDKTIERLKDWIDLNGYARAGPILERYLDVAPDEPPRADLRTEIWVPVERH